MITLWLDDVRNPATHGYPGATWAKSYKEAIEVLASGAVAKWIAANIVGCF